MSTKQALETRIDKGTLLTLDDVQKHFYNYNFLISLGKEMIDTSIYNSFKYG